MATPIASPAQSRTMGSYDFAWMWIELGIADLRR
jgi:hypothetical protein